MSNVRIRRMDELNFVIERLREKKEPGNPDNWEVLGYYGSLKSLLTHGLDRLVYGESARELLKGLETAQKTLLEAFQRAVEDGSLAFDPEPGREQGRKASAAKLALRGSQPQETGNPGGL